MATRHTASRLSARIETLAESLERSAPLLQPNDSGWAKIDRFFEERQMPLSGSLPPNSNVHLMSDQDIMREMQPWFCELLVDGVLTADDFER
jgi:hypothetical protein